MFGTCIPVGCMSQQRTLESGTAEPIVAEASSVEVAMVPRLRRLRRRRREEGGEGRSEVSTGYLLHNQLYQGYTHATLTTFAFGPRPPCHAIRSRMEMTNVECMT